MASLDTLTQNVTENTSAVQSAIFLLGNLKTELDAAIEANNNGDSSALDALSAQLAASDTALAAAVVANTPVAVPTPAPVDTGTGDTTTNQGS